MFERLLGFMGVYETSGHLPYEGAHVACCVLMDCSFFCCLCFMSLFIGSVYTDQMDLELGFQKAYSAPSG